MFACSLRSLAHRSVGAYRVSRSFSFALSGRSGVVVIPSSSTLIDATKVVPPTPSVREEIQDLKSLHQRLRAGVDIPSLAQATRAFSHTADRMTKSSVSMLLDFMLYNHRSASEISSFLSTALSRGIIDDSSNNGGVIEYVAEAEVVNEFIGDIVNAISYSLGAASDMHRLLKLEGLSPRSKNVIVKALLTRATASGDLEQVKCIERQLSHVDSYTAELFLYAFSRCLDIEGVRRWLQYGLRLEASSGVQPSKARTGRMYNFLVDVYCRSGNLAQALQLIRTEQRHMNAYSFGCVLKSLPDPEHRNITYSTVLQQMHNRGIAAETETFNTILWNVARNKKGVNLDEFYKWLHKMHSMGTVQSRLKVSMNTKSWNALLAAWCSHFRLTPDSGKLLQYMDTFPVFDKRTPEFQKHLPALLALSALSQDPDCLPHHKSSIDAITQAAELLSSDFKRNKMDALKLIFGAISTPNAKSLNLLLFLGLDHPGQLSAIIDAIKPSAELRHRQHAFALNPDKDNISTNALVDATTLNLAVFLKFHYRNVDGAFKTISTFKRDYNVDGDVYTYAMFLKYAFKTTRLDVLEPCLHALVNLRRQGMDRGLVEEGNVLDGHLQRLSQHKWISPGAKKMIEYLQSSRKLSEKRWLGKRICAKT